MTLKVSKPLASGFDAIAADVARDWLREHFNAAENDIAASNILRASDPETCTLIGAYYPGGLTAFLSDGDTYGQAQSDPAEPRL